MEKRRELQNMKKQNAKNIKPTTIDVRGMSIKDITNIPYSEIVKLGEADLKALTQRLNSAANKRIKRIVGAGLESYSPAVIGRRGGKKFQGALKLFTSETKQPRKKSTRAKGIPSRRNQLLEKFADVKKFLTDRKTATFQGAKKNKAEVLSRFPDLSERQQKRVWKLWTQLRDKKGLPHVMKDYFDSDDLQNILSKYIKKPSSFAKAKITVKDQDGNEKTIDAETGLKGDNASISEFLDRLSNKMYENRDVSGEELTRDLLKEMAQERYEMTRRGQGENEDDSITVEGDIL